MPGGIAALLDDVAALARTAASSVDDISAAAGKTSLKAVGVVVDDTAVTPQYVSGISPARELPMIWRITKGSLRNKLLIILPVALILSWIAPWALTPILMLGGSYLCFEGAEKIIHWVQHRGEEHIPASSQGVESEDQLVASAIRTDLILSAEIMVISLNDITDQPLLYRALILVVIAIIMTALVYGVVSILVKMDDYGLRLIRTYKGGLQKVGRALVQAMPSVLKVLNIIGTLAMLWVGGHIMITGLAEFGWHFPHNLALQAHHGAGGGFFGWCGETAISLIVGALWGAIITAAVSLVKKMRPAKATTTND
ncbi:DUF808 family protein [Corynebacterium sp. 3HC-13]|uniref:DUF808 domain-containing protein n=1 Tax=Corynebacterium poyangense TaxID=2684405 RepID=UPI001CCE345F|nr:DUF808 domain-containing protein [Corynebacterium poyangense]MBZ8176997.1 DUF808 family protein [Corynebacterium poyangense]